MVERGNETAPGDGISEEDAWVQRAKLGDYRAYEQLYRAYVGRVYGLCVRLCQDRDTAEDLAQEAFVLAWRKLSGFRGESSFGSWLYRIATNTALSYLRRQKSFVVSLSDAEWEEPSEQEQVGERMTLEKAIGELPRGARTVFILYSLEGYSHQEIAKTLKIAEGSSKAQLHRARLLLRGYLNHE